MSGTRRPVNFKILLDQVNRIRVALAIGEGKLDELPRGFQEENEHCVLARALSNGWHADVGVNAIILRHPDLEFDLEKRDRAAKALKQLGFSGIRTFYTGVAFTPTKTMENFIDRFDEGDFPHLILND